MESAWDYKTHKKGSERLIFNLSDPFIADPFIADPFIARKYGPNEDSGQRSVGEKGQARSTHCQRGFFTPRAAIFFSDKALFPQGGSVHTGT